MRASVWAAVFLALLTPATALAAPLRVSVPPLFGSVPVILASGEGWGLFSEEGLEVALEPLPSQTARLQAFRARQVDILVSDLTLALMIVSQRDADAVIAGSTYSPSNLGQNVAPPALLITPQRYSRISSLEELAREPPTRRLNIGVPRQSDLEFMLDQLFLTAGHTPPEQTYVGRDNLLDNANYLSIGRFHAGVFPQPYGQYLMAIDVPGDPEFVVLSEFSNVFVPPTVLVIRRSLLEQRHAEVVAFFCSLERAVERVNSLSREDLLELGWQLVTQLFMPGHEPHTMAPEDRERVERAIETLFIPDFPVPAPVDRESFEVVLSWARRKGYVRFPPEFDETVVPPVR